MEHKILNRYWDYVGMDTYGYSAKCSCGELITGWSKEECEENIAKHMKEADK